MTTPLYQSAGCPLGYALLTPNRTTFTIPNIPSFARDLHQVHWGRLGIDATKPLKHLADFERKKVPGFDDMDLGKYLR